MPTYIYRCSHCKHQFEKVQKFNDPPVVRCPSCRRKSVHKVLVASPIQFKGSGWYITDSKKSGSTSSSSESSKKKKESSAESTTTDAKPSTTTTSSDAD